MGPFIESDITDIEIAADGRVFIFGASREVMDLLAEIGIGRNDARRRMEAARRDAATHAPAQASRGHDRHE